MIKENKKKIQYLSIGELNTYLSAKFSYDPYLEKVYLTGEIFGYKIAYGSAFFQLQDEKKSSINAFMPFHVLQNTPFDLKSGDKVNVVASVIFYKKRSFASAKIISIKPAGLGNLFIKLNVLKKKLSREGIFNKVPKKLSFFPKKIAVVTSKTGAVIQDIKSTISHRNPNLELEIFKSQVQGSKASRDLILSLKEADESNCDAIIIARGGGSMFDLWSFNNEKLIRVIASLKKPIISSVGHQTDITLTDMAADYRVETPTAAANLVTPSINDYKEKYKYLIISLSNNIQKVYKEKYNSYQILAASSAIKSFDHIFSVYNQQLKNIDLRLFTSFNHLYQNKENRFLMFINRLDSVSPLKILKRGFSLTFKGERLIKDSKKLNINDKIKIIFSSGEALAQIKELKSKQRKEKNE